ncbi:MAG: hypothetical protein KDK41_08500 [Leptospiraceae bacterium]|nr:hypothetical protein [Leptospiraceae bacterium]
MSGENLSAKYATISVRISSEKEQYYGVILIVINRAQNYLENASVVIANSNKFQDVVLHDDWHKLDTFIQRIRYENNYATAISNDVQEIFKELGKRPEYLADFLKALKNDSRLKQLIFERLRRIIRDDRIQIETYTSEVQSLDKGPQEQVSTPSQPESAHTYIRSTLVLDPISGVSISTMKPGQKIMLKITDLSAPAQSFVNSNNLLAPKGVKPVAAEIVTLENTSEGLELECSFSPQLRTKITETERVMVQTPEAIAKTRSERAMNNKQGGSGGGGAIYFIGAVVVLLGLFFVYLIFG